MTSRGGLVLASATAVIVFALAYMLPSTIGKAYEMDEGAANAYASRVLDGAVPHRDFLTFYGPGNPWIIAGAFTLLGESVGVERAVGVAYRIVALIALFLLGRRLGGLLGAATAVLVAATIMAGELIWAYPTHGALAFALLGLALLSQSVGRAPGRWTTGGLVGSGLAGGLALLVRFDFTPAVVVSAVPLLAIASHPARRRVLAGFLVPLVIYGFHLAVVGPERIQRVVEDIRAAGPGRYLQRQTIWEYPANLLAAGGLATGALLLVGAYLVWRQRRQLEARVVLAVGLFALGLVPLTISRMDPLHIRPYAIVPLALLPALALHVARTLSSRQRRAFAGVVALSALWGVQHYGAYDVDHFRVVRHVPSGYRNFYDDDSVGARHVVERARRLAHPGESLFVGPRDLRRTNYGPTYMYFLLDELEPASYYMELNPGTANREGSGLADELRRADWLILTSEWDDWSEENESTEFGSSEPNEVVRDDFCLRFESGRYRLYERCDRAA